jgi:hypothetical protein
MGLFWSKKRDSFLGKALSEYRTQHSSIPLFHPSKLLLVSLELTGATKAIQAPTL